MTLAELPGVVTGLKGTVWFKNNLFEQCQSSSSVLDKRIQKSNENGIPNQILILYHLSYLFCGATSIRANIKLGSMI